ncbi:MAG: tetratricopeptide repeat protein [Rivicola pingtungensis]|nr:tetratricopeptide repeat protein [Rivihabitans pingtungensis]
MSINITHKDQRLSVQKAIEEARVLIDEGKFLEAETLARAVLKRHPKSHLCQQILGIALAEQDDPNKKVEALEACAAAVSAQPKNPHYINALANVTAQVGEYGRAEVLYEKALQISPGLPDAKYNLAKLWTRMGKFLPARDVFQEMLPVISNVVDVYQNLGACEFSLGNYKQALLWFKLALGYSPNNDDLHKNYATCLSCLNDYRGAIYHFNKALDLGNEDFSVLLNIAYAHHSLHEYSPAEEFALAFLEHGEKGMLPVDELNCLTLLSSIKKSLGYDVEANEIYYRIIEKFGDQAWAYSNYLFTRIFMENETQESLFEKHVDFARRYEAPRRELWGNYTNVPQPNRKLKIGYVSADFFSHSVSYFSLPLIANHDKSKFEIHCYSGREVEKDPVMLRIRREVHWHEIQGKSVEQVVEMIRQDEIDLLVDLSGHTGGNQLLTFACKPAPVQLTWIGYPFSTGLTAIDYRVVDNYIEPKGVSEHISSETLLRIDDCFCAYRPSISRPHRLTNGELDVRPTPALENGFITFGCCNNLHKVNEFTLGLWAKIMQRTPNSKLLLEASGGGKEDVVQAIRNKVQAAGIDPDRLIVSNRQQNPQYTLYHSIDIVLDPYPCNGGTTTCDALFMSVPVVSLKGDRFMSRLGATFISNAGHPEWVTEDPAEYVEIACRLAQDINVLNEIRQKLRHEVETSPVMDEIGFARKMERAYRQVWKTWCASQGVDVSEDDGIDNDNVGLTRQDAQALPLQSVLTEAELQAYHARLDQVKQAIHQENWEEVEVGLQKIADVPIYAIDHDYYLALSKIERSRSVSLASTIANQWMNEAAALLGSVLARQPDHVEAWLTQGKLQIYRNRYEEAEISMIRALKFSPDHVEALLYLAFLLAQRGDGKSALQRCERAKLLSPNLAKVYDIEATVHVKLGDAASAVKCQKHAVALDPENLQYLDKLLGYAILTQTASHQSFQTHLNVYREKLERTAPVTPVHTNTPVADKKLRVGLMSGHFYDGLWAHVWLPLCELISRVDMELFIFNNGEVVDKLLPRIQRCVPHIRYIRGLSPETTAALLADDQIDVLIVLDAYGEYSCLPVLAQHAVPVQLLWPQGYVPVPAGLVNYALTSEVTLDGERKGVSIPLALPLAYKPFMNNPEFYSMPIFQSEDLPANKNGYVTFGCASDLLLVDVEMLDIWASLLLAMPDAKLKLYMPKHGERVLELFKQRGVSHERVLMASDSRDSRYHFYLDVDIMLDTYPANDMILAVESLWMNVPVLTLSGEVAHSHTTSGLLKHLQLDEWIVKRPDDFVGKAVEMADDLVRLDALRHELRARLEGAGLVDCLGFAKSFSAALRLAWAHWCESDAASFARYMKWQQELLAQAGKLMGQEEYALASEVYLQVFKKDTECIEAAYGLGLAYLMQGNAELARDLLKHVLAQFETQQSVEAEPLPLLPDCLVSLAHACHMMGLNQEALEHFRHSLRYRQSEQVQQWIVGLSGAADVNSLH